MHLNRITLIGDVVEAPTANRINGATVTQFTIATHRAGGETPQERAAIDRHTLTAEGKLAEVAAEYLDAGSRVYVEGSLRQPEHSGVPALVVENLILLRPTSAL